MSALRVRLVEINARLGRATSWPWQVGDAGVIAPAVRASIPPDAGGASFMQRWNAIDDIEYYGGELVCESCSRENMELIAHAPADLAMLSDAVTLLMRDRDRLRYLMYRDRTGFATRRQIDIEMITSGHPLFTLARAELPRLSKEA